MTMRVQEALEETVRVYEDRQKQYGDSYKLVGAIMDILFPEGLPGGTINQIRHHLVGWMVGKLCRYVTSINNHRPGDDSLKDLAVYAMMLHCEEKNRGN